MNIFDKLGNSINEAVYGASYSDPVYKNLKGFYATDKQLDDFTYSGATNKDQVMQQVVSNKKDRDFLFSQIDMIKDHHLASTIKDVIIDDCFNGLCDKNLITIQYRSKDKKRNKLFNDAIQDFLSKSNFLDIFKDCLINEGINYGEMFLSTECVVGEGIVSISDDIDLNKHIAIYKNLSPIGFIRCQYASGQINPEEYIPADKISHFLISPKKIPIKISYDYNKDYDLPEKIRCAEPILTPVIDLIVEYNSLEKVRTAIELNKALAPILLSIGISSSSDMTEVRRQLQEYSMKINQTRNAVLNNLNNLNVNNLLSNMNPIQLIPFDPSVGTNKIEQISVDQVESNLTEKLNDLKRTIAQAVGIPDNYLATTTLISGKGDNIETNARYSRMLSGIQQSLSKGILEMVLKHLRYRFSKLDSNGKMYLEREIDKNDIEVKFKSVTNIDNRLDMEQMLLTANTMSEIAGVVDVVTGSPNLPVKTSADTFLKLWQNVTEPYPYLRDIFEKDKNAESNMDFGFDGYDPEDDIDTGSNSIDAQANSSNIKKTVKELSNDEEGKKSKRKRSASEVEEPDEIEQKKSKRDPGSIRDIFK